LGGDAVSGLVDDLRAKHGDGPPLWDALARLLHKAHMGSKGQGEDFSALSLEFQERWLDRAIRMDARSGK